MPNFGRISDALAGLTSDVQLAGVARGDLLYRGASKWQNRAVGTAGQVLTVQDIGGGVLEPRWGTVSDATKLPLAGGTLTGNVSVTDAGGVQRILIDRGGAVSISNRNGNYGQFGLLTLGDTATAAGDMKVSVTAASLTLALDSAREFKLAADALHGQSRARLTNFRGISDIMHNAGGDGSPALFVGNATANAAALNITAGSASQASTRLLFRSSGEQEWTPLTTVQARAAARITPGWADNTDASRKGRLTVSVLDAAGAREVLRLEADGAAPRLGVLGAAAIARQALPTAAADEATTQALANALRQLMIDFGFAS